MSQQEVSENFHDSVAGYVRKYREHQQSFEAHLKGRTDDGFPLLPAFIPPASYWTSLEKDLFFHGLTLHSRLRPDLIAEHIKTKSTLDVCLYLDTLQQAVERELAQTPTLGIRETIKPAMEVSDRWIRHEENIAMQLTELDVCPWSMEDIEEGSSRGANRRTCTSVNNDGATQISRDQGTGVQKAQREYLNHLDSSCLMVLENIIREAEAETADSDVKTSQANVLGGASALASGRSLPSISPETIMNTSQLDVVNVDSNIQLTLGVQSDSQQVALEQELIEDSEPSHGKTDFRRRLQKRLYMRRKRAERAGKAAIAEHVKLRPGRQKRLRKPSKPRPKTYKSWKRPVSGADSPPGHASPDPHSVASPHPALFDMNLEEAESMYETHSKSGITKPYRIKNFFLDNGLDAHMLFSMDLNFFHLSTIARLLRLYHSINDPTGPLNAISVSADSVQLLMAIATEFLSEIIHRVIITKEQDARLKGTMKVWKSDRDEISAENVKECMNSMGLGHLNKERYFMQLLGHGSDAISVDGDNSSTAAATGQLRNDNEEDNEEDLHFREFTLPQSLLWCALPSHRYLFSPDETSTLEINDNVLQKELEEEDELDAEDEGASKEYEQQLWKEWKVDNTIS